MVFFIFCIAIIIQLWHFENKYGGENMSNMKGEKKMTRTSLCIPDDLLMRVRLQTVREKRSMSDLMRVLLEEYLEKIEDKKHV